MHKGAFELQHPVLYATSQHLWKTTDEGKNWERISPDLTKADPKTLAIRVAPSPMT